MATPTKTVDSRVCTVCGQPATAPDVKYMEPRCLEHAHTLRPPSTGREVPRNPATGQPYFKVPAEGWAGKDEHRAKAAKMFGVAEEAVTPEQRRYAKTAAFPERYSGKHPALAADYGGLELRVLAHSLEQLAGHIAYEMSRIMPIDMPTARALVDAAARVLTSKGPVTPDDLRYQPPLMTATEINELPPKAREYIHQLVANADPAGMVRENMQLLDTNKGLQVMYRNRTDELDRAKMALELARNGLAWYRDAYPEADSGADDEMMEEIDTVLDGGTPTVRPQKHIGYMVCSDGRYMYWPVEDLQVARTYCEDNVEPVKLMADEAELSKHEDGQI